MVLRAAGPAGGSGAGPRSIPIFVEWGRSGPESGLTVHVAIRPGSAAWLPVARLERRVLGHRALDTGIQLFRHDGLTCAGARRGWVGLRRSREWLGGAGGAPSACLQISAPNSFPPEVLSFRAETAYVVRRGTLNLMNEVVPGVLTRRQPYGGASMDEKTFAPRRVRGTSEILGPHVKQRRRTD